MRLPSTLALMNHWIIALFGVTSGIYKVMGGEADVRVFSALGMTPTATAVFGAIQALAALATIPLAARPTAAWLLAACNLLASAGLFAAGVIPFGVVSLLFVVSAWWVTQSRSGAGSHNTRAP